MAILHVSKKGLLNSEEKEIVGDSVTGSYYEYGTKACDMGAKDHINRMMKLVIECKGKPVEELTEEEKFSLCFFHGCEIDFWHFNEVMQAYIPRTKYPCAITKYKDGFHVIEGR